MKRLTDIDGGFFSRRGLSHTRYAFQKERPGGAIFYLGFFFIFAATGSNQTSARVLSAILSVFSFFTFVTWTTHSFRAIMKAYRRDMDEKNERSAREVMES